VVTKLFLIITLLKQKTSCGLGGEPYSLPWMPVECMDYRGGNF